MTSIRIGYVALAESGSADDEALLEAAGCAVIRRETEPGWRELHGILNFMGPGDELVAPSIRHIARAPGGLANLVRRLDVCGADLHLLREQLSTCGEAGELLRRALAAAAELPSGANRGRGLRATPDQAWALSSSGAAPSRIARELNVSRMTVWRWLKRAPATAVLEAAGAP